MHELGTVFYVIKQVEQLALRIISPRSAALRLRSARSAEYPEVRSGLLGLGDKGHDLSQKHRAEDRDARRRHLLRGLRQDNPTVKYAKICPYCGSEHTFLLAGNEYNIKEIEAM